jgi:hypothetical protein
MGATATRRPHAAETPWLLRHLLVDGHAGNKRGPRGSVVAASEDGLIATRVRARTASTLEAPAMRARQNLPQIPAYLLSCLCCNRGGHAAESNLQ